MGKHYETIPPEVVPWIKKQHVFFVGTAPLSPGGHVNISPKGVEGTFHLVDERTCWYEDLTGSGIETISHIRENARITIMFCAFEGPPRILRLWGTGSVYEVGTAEYDSFVPRSDRKPGSRAVIKIDIHKVGTSCGYAVPFFSFDRYRTQLEQHFAHKELQDLGHENSRAPNGMLEYWKTKNTKSIDGLPGLQQGVMCQSEALHVLPRGYIGVGEAQKWSKSTNSSILKSFLTPVSQWLASPTIRLSISFLMGALTTEICRRSFGSLSRKWFLI
ncbi:hypothetical protein FRC14_006234 [Serendipita sp. 396]|nr:hypothetical protein FRC14_006234 [Serendipita sp. 396]KAG8789597.1 hypothetical protein FRC15_006329 [Serendipita sp. 397]KAG8878075.1 hypothetical protein FRC20_009360 [Serendipita sp. 405]